MIHVLRGQCDTLIQPNTEAFLNQKRALVISFKYVKTTTIYAPAH